MVTTLLLPKRILRTTGLQIYGGLNLHPCFYWLALLMKSNWYEIWMDAFSYLDNVYSKLLQKNIHCMFSLSLARYELISCGFTTTAYAEDKPSDSHCVCVCSCVHACVCLCVSFLKVTLTSDRYRRQCWCEQKKTYNDTSLLATPKTCHYYYYYYLQP